MRLVGRRILVVVLTAVVLAGCGGTATTPPGERTYPVTSHRIAHRTTQPMRVWRPDAQGRWPVLYAMPGVGGDLDRDLGVLGPALARHGLVVFGTNIRVQGSPAEQTQDAVCGYRYARTVAPRYGGDLASPVTVLGYSYSAAAVLTEDPALFGPGGSYDVCFRGSPPAQVRVGVNGCYFGPPGHPQPFSADRLPIRRSDSVVLIAAARDRTCPAWQSVRVAREMRRAGYDVTLDVIPGADHYAAIFHALAGRTWRTVPGSSAGARTVQDVQRAIARRMR